MEQTRIELSSELIVRIIEGARDLSYEADYDFSDDAFKWNLKQWAKNKAHLYNVLSKDKDFNENELAIVKNISVNRSCNNDIAQEILNDYLRIGTNYATRWTISPILYLVDGDGMLKYSNYLPSNWENHKFNDKEISLMDWCNVKNDIILSDFSRASVLLKSLNFKDGQKASKVIRKILDKFNLNNWVSDYISFAKPVRKLDENGEWTGEMTKCLNYEQMFAQLSDNLSPKTFNYKLVISINPLDYLTQSRGNGWSSCHAFSSKWDNSYSGCNKGATLTMMTDPSSVITYLLDIDDENTDLWNIEKNQRQTYFVSDTHDFIVANEVYPTRDKNVGNIILDNMLNLFNPSSEWTKNHDFDYHTRNEICCFDYDEYYGFDDWNKSGVKCNFIKNELGNKFNLTIGHRAKTINDNDSFITENDKVITCGYWCDYCYCYHDEDDLYWSDYYGRYICQDELEREFYYCEDIDDYRDENDCWYNEYDGYWYSNGTYNEYVEDYGYVDEYNLNNSCDFFQCEECGCWFYCGYENMNVHDCYYYCDNCYEELELGEEGDEE